MPEKEVREGGLLMLTMRSETWLTRTLLMAMMFSIGCASARLPLCPKVAHLGMSTPSSDVNQYLEQRLPARRIKVEPLSAFAAEFRGSLFSIHWLRRNYAFMLCAFNPKDVIEDEALYNVCMANAPRWMEIVSSKRPDELVLSTTHYVNTCVE